MQVKLRPPMPGTHDGTVKLGSNVSVGGTTNHHVINAHHVHRGVPEPKFPYVDAIELLFLHGKRDQPVDRLIGGIELRMRAPRKQH
jgi:hypothetical protein